MEKLCVIGKIPTCSTEKYIKVYLHTSGDVLYLEI